MVALSLIAVAVVITTCGLGSYLLVRDDNKIVGAGPTVTPEVPKRDISSRTTDPALLSVADVFPDKEIMADPTIPPYKRLGNPQMAKDCRVGATSDLGKLLNKLGCNQVVRATFVSPDSAYVLTAGIFNLKDSASTTKAHTEIKQLVDTSKGRFSGLISHSSAKVLGRAPTNLAWDTQGHFLIYSVIARADGKEFAPDDPHAKIIVYDIVEKYLRDHVIVQWSIDRGTPGASGPAASASAKASPTAG